MKSRCALGWLIVGILIQGMQLSGAEAMEGSIIAYNAGPETRSGVALGDLAGLGIALPQGGVTVKDGDRIVPSQLSGNGLAVWITLKGYEHRRLTVLAGTNGASAQIAQPLRHVEDKAAWMTLGKDVTIRIDKKVQGIASLQMGGARFDARPGFDVWVFPETTDKRQPDPWRWVQPNMQGKAGDFTVATLATGPLFTCYHLQWSCDEAKVDERITYCSGDSFARFDVQVELLKPVSEVIFNYNCYYNMDLQNTLFYPAEARPVGRYQSYKAVHFGRYDKAPGYVLGWSPKQGGIGFAVPDQGLFTRFAYAVTDHPDYGSFHGTNNDAGVHFYITARSERLLDKPAGTVLKGTVYPFTASKAEDRDGILARINSPLCLRKANPVDIVGVVQIDSVMALKETTSVKASLRNYSDKPTTGAIGIGLSSFHKDMVSVKTVTDIPAGGENTISTDIVPAVRGPQELWLGGKEAVSKLRINVQPVVAVENVWPNKVLYANDETAKCEVTLKNWKPQPVTVKLETSLYTDIDRQESLDSRDVALQPLERKTVTLEWNTGKREYGCEIRSVVKQGTNLLNEGCEYFNIATDWLKVMQSGYEGRFFYQNLIKWNNFQAEDGTLIPPRGDYLPRVPRNRRP
ncbi:MAG: hypothetical protein L6437_13055, partial [Kiritimatiellae bacterium]|nr:hypothetical protein [Kiritimatiellia bacterium]